MKIIIQETNEAKILTLIDPVSGVNWVHDFISPTPVFTNGYLTWDKTLEAYVCKQATYDILIEIISAKQKMDSKLHTLKERFGAEIVDQVMAEVRNDYDEMMKASGDENHSPQTPTRH